MSTPTQESKQYLERDPQWADASRSFRAPAVYRSNSPASNQAADELLMPATAEQAARDIQRESVEGRPGDPTSGPALLRMELYLLLGVLLVIAVGMGIWVGPMLGIATFVVGALALVLNPVAGATAMRIGDRVDAAEKELRRTEVLSHIQSGKTSHNH